MTRNEVRIIGGLWKGRKLQVPAGAPVRPSLGRVRETLFNWLAGEIEGRDCLDLFAGSGALGFEALSRGARSAMLVDNNRAAAEALRRNAERLEAGNCAIRRQSALAFLKQRAQDWDIVFLDPPFAANLLGKLPWTLCAPAIHCVPGRPRVLELDRRGGIDLENWRILKQGTAGDTRFGLLASP